MSLNQQIDINIDGLEKSGMSRFICHNTYLFNKMSESVDQVVDLTLAEIENIMNGISVNLVFIENLLYNLVSLQINPYSILIDVFESYTSCIKEKISELITNRKLTLDDFLTEYNTYYSFVMKLRTIYKPFNKYCETNKKNIIYILSNIHFYINIINVNYGTESQHINILDYIFSLDELTHNEHNEHKTDNTKIFEFIKLIDYYANFIKIIKKDNNFEVINVIDITKYKSQLDNEYINKIIKEINNNILEFLKNKDEQLLKTIQLPNDLK